MSGLAFPGAEGYGAVTRGAYSGSDTPTILIVDSLSAASTGDAATGRGTFLWAITRNYPRIVMFEVCGIIDYRERTSAITITNSHLTLAGQTSPKEGITVFGTNVIISNTSHIIMQHIRVRVGNHPPGQSYDRRGVSIWGSTNIIVDHISGTWAMRQLIEVGNAAENVSVTNSLYAECLHNAEWTRYTGVPSNHGYGSLLREASNLTFKNNVLAYATYRNPSIKRFANAVLLNNFIYPSGDPTRNNLNPSGTGMIYDGDPGMLLDAAIVGNVVLSTEATKASGTTWKYVGQVTSDTDLGTKLYVDDNICDLLSEEPETPEAERWLIYKEGFEFENTSPIDLSGYTIIPASQVEAYVLANAGAKHWYRDPTDERLISQMTNRQGEYVDSVYPRYARVYNWWLTGGGDMTNGFDWATNPTTLTVNGTTLTLDQNCANVQAVIDYLNTMMPAGTEAYKHYGCDFVGLKTIALGSTESIIVSGDGLADFGIQAGTYYGDDGVADWNYDSDARALTSIEGYPEENPHVESAENAGYTNLQIWIHELDESADPVEPPSPLPSAATLITDAQGKASKRLAPGLYAWKVAKTGYVSQEDSIEVGTVNMSIPVNLVAE